MAGAPLRDLEGIRAADAALLATIESLDDDTARQPSRLPGWSVGHVLTHVARNADSVVRRLEGTAAGVLVDQYVGGAEGRAAVQQAIDAMPEDLSRLGAGSRRRPLLADWE